MTQPITHAAVVAHVIDELYSDSPRAAIEFKSNCKAWCAALGSSIEDPAEQTLGNAYQSKVDEYQALLNRTHPGQPTARKNVRTAAAKLHATYVAMLASQELPADFNSAFKAAMDALDYKPADLNRILKDRFFHKLRPNWHGAQLWGFYEGTAGPGTSWKGDSRLLLQRCEEVLGLAPNVLISRAYPTTNPIRLGTRSEIPYRQARSAQWEARYALPSLPKRIATIVNDYANWRGRRSHLINGVLHVVEGRSLWTKPASADMARMRFKRFFGWLCLPAPTRPLADLSDEERWLAGKGMHVDELRMAHLFDINLLWEHIEFQRFRQHNQVLTESHQQLLMTVNSFVSRPYSYLTAHPEVAEEFGFPVPKSASEWFERVEDFHQRLLKVMRSTKRMVERQQRNPDEPLRHVLEDAAPYALFLQMVEQLEQSPPLKANRQTWSIWARDVALCRMELEVPLRAKNVVELTLGRHLQKDPVDGLWHLLVPKIELKNFYSAHAENISRAYSLATSAAIDRYLNEARCNLIGHAESSVFLLGPAAGRRANGEFVARAGYKLSTDAVHQAIGKHLKAYFGVSQGITIFRHLIATSILKDDPTKVDVAAAVLNNSPNSIRANYRHLTQSDGLRLADKWFQLQGARKTDKGRKGS